VAVQHVDGKKDKVWTRPCDFEPITAFLPAKQLRENTISTLDLNNRGLGVDGGQILAALISLNTSLHDLQFRSNQIGFKCSKFILDAVKAHPNLDNPD
jgi:hypothetical protein